MQAGEEASQQQGCPERLQWLRIGEYSGGQEQLNRWKLVGHGRQAIRE